MDLLSLSVGFVVGAFTGAAGAYLGEKYTDKRRSKEARRAKDDEWAEICRRFPAVIEEMKKDVQSPEAANIREFFLKTASTTLNAPEPHFEYYTDVHPELPAAAKYLEDLGYIEDVTPGNCPMYRMREVLVDRLRNA
ncbi:MAG: DUF456 domain-containing protein [Planctomycetales bacterium]|nr:DUF456 domain-containing protein [Planctomycetales bacterium]